MSESTAQPISDSHQVDGKTPAEPPELTPPSAGIPPAGSVVQTAEDKAAEVSGDGLPPTAPQLGGVLLYLVALWLVAVACAGVLGLLSLWPLAQHVQLITSQASAATPPKEPTALPTLHLLISHPHLTADLSVILLGILAGVLGSLVHTMSRLTRMTKPKNSKGNPRQRHEALWFILAPVQGGLLAFLVIAAVAAGLLSTGQSSGSSGVNLFAIAAIGGFAGLFSKRMTARLAVLMNQVGPPATPSTQQAAQQAIKAADRAQQAAALAAGGTRSSNGAPR
jgi:hypothetical protein